MKPVWIIDDDRSIRWVFEKALARENIAFKTFASAQEALAALEHRHAAGGGERHPHARRIRAWNCCSRCKAAHRRPAGHHHDRLFRPGKRGGGVPGRRLRIPAQAVRRRPGGGADPARAGREPAPGRRQPRNRGSRHRRSSARRRRCRRCSAPSAGCRSRTPRC